MISWSIVPALRFSLALMCGIYLSSVLAETATWYVAAVALAIGLIVLSLPVPLSSRAAVRGGAVFLMWTVAGLIMGSLRAPSLNTFDTQDTDGYILALDEPASHGGKWLKGTATLLEAKTDSVWSQTPEARVQLFVSAAVADTLGEGAVLAITSQIAPPRPPLNPHTFDYRAYLAEKGVGLQAFVKPGEVRILYHGRPPSLLARMRAAIARQLDLALPTSKEAAVAKALLLGDKGSLDDETRDTYARTGAVHVLAVSGLHTGVIAQLIVALLMLFRRGINRYVRLALLAAALFAYAALTGFSPSVMRSGVMFGALFAGQVLRLETNPFNSLGLSATIILFVEPYLLFSLGFQLSFAAVAGILAFYPTLRKWFASEYWALSKLGDLTAVSIAATLATAPITAYHFHQFPVYFIVSGIFAVPLVTAALWSLIGATIIHFFAVLVFGDTAFWAFVPGYLSVWLCNISLEAITWLPSGLLEGLWPSKLTAWLSFATVVSAGVTALRRTRLPFHLTCVLLLATGASTVHSTLARLDHEEIVVYSARHILAVERAKNGTSKLDYRELEPIAGSKLQRLHDAIASHRHAVGVRSLAIGQDSLTPPLPAFSVHRLGDLHYGVYAAPDARHMHQFTPELNFVVVTAPRNIEAAQLSAAFGADQTFVFTDYIPSWRQGGYDELSLKHHVLPRDGAFYPVGLATSPAPN